MQINFKVILIETLIYLISTQKFFITKHFVIYIVNKMLKLWQILQSSCKS